MEFEPTAESIRRAHCWFGIDRIPRDAETTTWKRIARLHQANWRAARGYPIGAQPYEGGEGSAPVGSRLALEFALESGANFLTPAALSAVRERVANRERHQMLHEARLWADLLSSMPLCFNVFGDLAADADRARQALSRWWPDVPEGRTRVRFEYSPARRDPSFLGNRSAFDVAFEVAGERGTRAVLGIETKYHEHAKIGVAPEGRALSRYVEVSERSKAFAPGWRERVIGTDLQQIWLDHLLALAMLQHRSKRWHWARLVLVYPARNPSFARAAAAYRSVLADATTFEARTLEDLLATEGALDPAAVTAIRERYLW